MKNILKLLMLLPIFIISTTYGQYSGIGNFSEITSESDLSDGYYVIVEESKKNAMNNTHNGTILGKTSISPSLGKIVNPDPTIVWKIETNANGKTIYSENTNKYISYTGSRNNIQVVNNVTTDNQRWTFSYANNVFSVKNLAVPNRILQYNSRSPRFVCYKSNQKKLILYKMGSGAVSPDLALGAVSGNTNESGTSATFTVMLTTQPASNVTLNVTSGNTGEITVTPAQLTFTSTNWNIPQTVTATGVDDTVADGDQDVTITVAVNNAASHATYHNISRTTKITNKDNELANANPVSLTNGNFENWANGAPTGWTKAENGTQETTTTNVQNGTNAIKVVATSTRDIAQTISGIVPGHYYKISLWYKVETGDKTDARIWSFWKNGTTNIDNNDYDTEGAIRGPYNKYFKSNNKWTRYEAVVKAPVGADKFYFEARTYRGATVYWDNFEFSLVNAWTGATDNNWNTNTNWSLKTVPTTTQDVIIPNNLTNYPTINSPTTIKSLIIKSGATLVANASVTGEVTYERNLTTKWHLVSSPVSGETVEDLIANTHHSFATGTVNTNHVGIANYIPNATHKWSYYQKNGTGSLKDAEGLAIKLSKVGVITFKGSLNSSNSVIANNIVANDFNLVGNPYSAYINLEDFFTENSNSGKLKEDTIWLWDGTKYVEKLRANDSGFKIAPGQGFFVKANISAPYIPFTTKVSHEATSTFLKEKRTLINLNITNGKHEDAARMFYLKNNVTRAFDNGYDGTKFDGPKQDLLIYTHLLRDNEGKKIGTQSLPLSDIENTVVPVGVIAKANQKITISADAINLPNRVNIYLEDRVNGVFTNLLDNNYTILLGKNANGVGQFYLHTSAQALSVGDEIKQQLNNVSVYQSNNNELSISGLQAERAVINVYSVLGKQMLTKTISSNGMSTINLPSLSSGVYVLNITSSLGKISRKVVLK